MSVAAESFLDGRILLHPGDCLDVLDRLEECSIDSCVTDPPYHLTSIVKRFGGDNAAPAKAMVSGDKAFQRLSSGFMGKQWDGGDVAFRPELWAKVYRVLKPGAHLLAFGGARTYHRMACAIEDAGFEIRDTIMWVYGSGFPKSHNIGNGWGTALKPACEPIVLARKPLSEPTIAANVLKWGTGAINVDGCRVATDEPAETRARDNGPTMGYGGCTVPFSPLGHAAGRWPANLIHDGSEEVVAAFPAEAGSFVTSRKTNKQHDPSSYGFAGAIGEKVGFGDSGSAARFFYTAKADSDDRLGSKHPTVKPLDLMQYLVRLITPPRGLVLDPFAGTGTTGEAAWRDGMSAVLIEREAEYQDDIRRRMKLALGGPDERARESIKARMKGKPADHGPLFGVLAT